jgi:lysophospholipase L1-like esterase
LKDNGTPTHSFAVSGVLSASLLVGMLTLQAGAMHLPNRGILGWLRDAIAVCRGRDVPWDRVSRAETKGGYYERLLNPSSEPINRSLLERLWKGKPAAQNDPYIHAGFLIYQPKPLLNLAESEDGPISTNSHGMIDREYSEAKPTDTVRIAIFGDSESRGLGLPNPKQQRFTTLLEQRLNSSLPGDRIKHVEVLNFSVSAYRPTQIYYVATEKAPAFHPDLYLMMLTPLGTAPGAGVHLGEVVREGIDLRYDFMRQAVKVAGVNRSDSWVTAQSKLEPYRFSLLREVLIRLKAQVGQQGATFGVVLLPGAEVPRITAQRFEPIRELVAEVGVSTIDLLDTFDQVSDIETVRRMWSDIHPNAEGHRLIANNFYRRLRAQPVLWSALTESNKPATLVSERK